MVKQLITYMNSEYVFYSSYILMIDHIRFSLMNIISKIAAAPISNSHKTNDATSPLSPPTKTQVSGSTSSLTTSVLSIPGTMDVSVMGLSEGQLKRQGLDCLAFVLRSLVAWGTAAGKAVDETVQTPFKPQAGEEIRREALTPDGSVDRLSVASTETLRQPTPELADDPSKFQSAKQKKTTLLEGIKKFNFKPKRVSLSFPS